MFQRELPLEWSYAQLGDVVAYGKTQKCVLSDVSDKTWVLELEDVEKESSKVLARKTAAERPFKSTKNLFEKGDVLYGKLRPYLNKVVLADAPGVCTTEIVPLNAEPFVLNRYLFYWLKTHDFLSYVTGVSYGVNMPRLGTKDGVVAPMVLAPLAEQKVIVDKLDTLLAQVGNTKARLERIPEILKRFRQSVLAAAVSGRLTEEFRRSSYLPEAVAGSFMDFFDIQGGTQPPKSSFISEPREGYVRLLQIRDFGDKEVPTYVPDANSLKKCDDDDVLLGRYGASIGRVCSGKAGAYNVALAKIISLENISSVFLKILVSSPSFFSSVNNFQRSAQNGFNKKDLATINVNIPCLEEQTEIVRRVDQLFAYADTIEQQVNSALERVNQLSQSILAKAFRGELTAQWREDNPELISGENSAEALLERIKAEREAIKRQPKQPKRTAGKKNTGSSMSKQVIKVVEALKQAGTPLSGQQLLAAAGYPSNSKTEELEQFFLDIRQALSHDKSIVKLERSEDGQDWFSLAEDATNE
ncbi:restriction endonuclease subunit S [Chromohalobacter sarecensis]|uniref:Restriction endonuclease subunit S n=1 Tax=Chromohalobacter sarecensis TaxID=245294 RepID=A0ABV9CZ80_9GAMM|nr:restriction endonuclease subunit S [Chromohalobacter sarecensis]MCK0714933.1 restriction endonuclease subunit S [Chromohalobacter sarecensis]